MEAIVTSELLERARTMGEETGRAAAGWTFDGNTSTDTYRRFLELSDAGDPAIDDFSPGRGWLSGEFADEPTPRTLLESLELDYDDTDTHDTDALCDAYEAAADEAYWGELERVAHLHTDDTAGEE